MNTTQTIPTFFSEGIRFECVHCGECCTGRPGIVAVDLPEVEALAHFLSISTAECIERHLIPHGQSYRIRERANGDCLFFHEGCSIHPVRPTQRRTYPFWVKNMRSSDAWQHTTNECPGVGQGPLYSESEILGILEVSPI